MAPSPTGFWTVYVPAGHSSPGAGAHLSEASPVLSDLATHFSDVGDVRSLAVYLLKGVGQGGEAFLDGLSSPGVHLPQSKQALAVFQEWCRRKPSEALGERLYQVLVMDNVNPSAALHFKEKLCPAPTYPGQ